MGTLHARNTPSHRMTAAFPLVMILQIDDDGHRNDGSDSDTNSQPNFGTSCGNTKTIWRNTTVKLNDRMINTIE